MQHLPHNIHELKKNTSGPYYFKTYYNQITVNNQPSLTRWKSLIRQIARTTGDIFYGATIYEMVRDLKKERSHLEHLFILIVFGDLLGVPVLPPYYTLRLLPYVMPDITGWKHSLLRERDLTDMCDVEIT